MLFRVPLILYGERGCGKSGLISKLATMIPEWYWLKDFAVVLRTHETDISWNTRELLTSLCAQIHIVNDELNLVDDIPRVSMRFMMTSSTRNIFRVIGPRLPVDSPHKVQSRGALMFSLICARTNGWANNRHVGHFRRHRTHYDLNIKFFLGADCH